MITTNRMLGISVARRNTRRVIVVLYWSFLVVFSWGFMHHHAHQGFDNLLTFNDLLLAALLPALLGGVRAGGPVKPFRGVHWIPWATDWNDYSFKSFYEIPDTKSLLRRASTSDVYTPLDERETRLRDRVHFLAYTLARWLALLILAVYLLFAAIDQAWIARLGPMIVFMLTLTLWSLPQTMILWTEPNVEESR
jgi:hypothetical protein